MYISIYIQSHKTNRPQKHLDDLKKIFSFWIYMYYIDVPFLLWNNLSTCQKIVSSNFREHLLSTYQMYSSVLGALWGPGWMRQDECLLGAHCVVREGQYAGRIPVKHLVQCLVVVGLEPVFMVRWQGTGPKVMCSKEVDWSDNICAVSRELWRHQDWGKR